MTFSRYQTGYGAGIDSPGVHPDHPLCSSDQLARAVLYLVCPFNPIRIEIDKKKDHLVQTDVAPSWFSGLGDENNPEWDPRIKLVNICDRSPEDWAITVPDGWEFDGFEFTPEDRVRMEYAMYRSLEELDGPHLATRLAEVTYIDTHGGGAEVVGTHPAFFIEPQANLAQRCNTTILDCPIDADVGRSVAGMFDNVAIGNADGMGVVDGSHVCRNGFALAGEGDADAIGLTYDYDNTWLIESTSALFPSPDLQGMEGWVTAKLESISEEGIEARQGLVRRAYDLVAQHDAMKSQVSAVEGLSPEAKAKMHAWQDMVHEELRCWLSSQGSTLAP